MVKQKGKVSGQTAAGNLLDLEKSFRGGDELQGKNVGDVSDKASIHEGPDTDLDFLPFSID